MSGGYFNHVGYTVNDALTGVAENDRVRRRWPKLASLLVAVGGWFQEAEHAIDWDLSGDRAIEDDSRWERRRIARILQDVLQAARDGAGDPDTRRLLELATQRREFVTFEDGYVYYCPSEARGLSSWMLRALADDLDQRNRAWDERVNRELSGRE